MEINLNSNNLFRLQKLNKKDLIIFLIPLVIFSYYLYVLNPGVIAWDGYFQLHQIATNNLTNWHPFFHTFILMVCVEILGNLIYLPIFQILTFSTMWMVICKYSRDDSLKDSKSFILQCIVTLVISLIPINPLYSVFISKDTLFCYFLMFLCFLIKVIIDKKGQISPAFLLVLTIVMSFVAQLRYNGIIIVSVLLVVLAVYFFKNNKKQNFHILMPVLTITFILLISSLNIVYDVEDNQKDMVLSKTAHMLSDYELNLEIDDNDKEKLDELINQSSLKENYHVSYSDTIYDSLNQDVYETNKETYIFMAIKYSLKDPIHFIKYLFESSPIVWKIVKDDNWVHYAGIPPVSPRNVLFYNVTKEVPSASYDNATFVNIGTPEYENLKFIRDYVSSNKVTDTLLNSPGLYMYLSLIVLGIMYFITKSRDLFFVYLPIMINIVILFLSIPAPQIRYLYSNFLVFYLLIILSIGIFEKRKCNNIDESIT